MDWRDLEGAARRLVAFRREHAGPGGRPMSQRELAERLGMREGSGQEIVAHWEGGRNEPKPYLWVALEWVSLAWNQEWTPLAWGRARRSGEGSGDGREGADDGA